MKHKRLIMVHRLILLALVAFLSNNVIIGQKSTFYFQISEREIRNAREFVMDETFKEIRIIPLETSKLCFIGKIKKVKTTTDRIYILSKNTGENASTDLLVFNSKGDFIRKVGSNGKGPGEYIQIQDFSISKNNGNLLILDLEKIIEFDAHGNFVKTHKIALGLHSILPTRIEQLPNKQFLIESSGPFQLGLFDESGALVKSFSSLYNKNIDLPCPFTFFKEHFLINMLFVDPIYTTDNNGILKPYVNVDFRHLNLDIASYEEYSKKNFGQLPRDRVIRDFVAENSEEFIIKFALQWEYYIGVLSKLNGTTKIYHIGNSNVSQTRMPNAIFQSESGDLIFWADPSQFKEPFEKWMTGKLSKRNYELVSDRKVDASSNPVVIVGKL